MRFKAIILLLFSFLFFISCDVVLKPANRYVEEEKSLSDTEVAAGLRKALIVGAGSAVNTLGRNDGFYNNPDVKIPLPGEMDNVIKYAKKVPGLEKLVLTIGLQINRAAEDAAKQAVPVFNDAITSMPIYDVWGILNGEESAATYYLKEKTYDQLYTGFIPIVKKSLQKPINGNEPALKSWDDITIKWNNFSNSFAGKLLEVEPLTVDLDDYVTNNALYGLFIEIAREEKNIRNDYYSRDDELLRRVFGNKKKK